MSKPSVLKVAGEPVAVVYVSQNEIPMAGHGRFSWLLNPVAIPNDTKLYTESQLLAMYAAGAEDMRERAAKACDEDGSGRDSNGYFADIIRDLPITTTTTKEQ